MSFVNIAPFGGYVTGDFITETQINYWCSALPDCVDGAGGGTYTLAAPLIFTGDAVEIDELITDDLTVTDLTATGAVELGAPALGTTMIHGDAIVGTTSSNNMVVNSTTTFLNSVSILGNTTLGNAVSDTVTVNSVLSYGSTGRTTTTHLQLPDATGSHNVTQARYVNAQVSAPRTYTLSFTSPVEGDWVRIFNGGPSDTITLAGLIATTLAAGAGLMLMRVSGAWVPVESWTNT